MCISFTATIGVPMHAANEMNPGTTFALFRFAGFGRRRRDGTNQFPQSGSTLKLSLVFRENSTPFLQNRSFTSARFTAQNSDQNPAVDLQCKFHFKAELAGASRRRRA